MTIEQVLINDEVLLIASEPLSSSSGRHPPSRLESGVLLQEVHRLLHPTLEYDSAKHSNRRRTYFGQLCSEISLSVADYDQHLTAEVETLQTRLRALDDFIHTLQKAVQTTLGELNSTLAMRDEYRDLASHLRNHFPGEFNIAVIFFP